MKRFYFLIFFAFWLTPNLATAAGESCEIAVGASVEKPKPGSKRWHRSQKHVRNPGRKKYPKMRKWHTNLQVDVTEPVALVALGDTYQATITVPVTEQNGVVVVYPSNS
jgi:hypothetical protein